MEGLALRSVCLCGVIIGVITNFPVNTLAVLGFSQLQALAIVTPTTGLCFVLLRISSKANLLACYPVLLAQIPRDCA